MKKKIIIGFSILIFISGCYTVLKHPEIENKDDAGNVYYGKVAFQDDCTKCHNSRYGEYTYDFDRYSDYYNEGYLLNNDYNYEPRNNWIGYYNIPWWYRPNVTITQGTGLPQTTGNRTTNSQPEIRTIGSTRNDVNISTPPPTRGVNNSSGTGTTEVKNDDTKTSDRGSTRTNTNTNANNSSNTNSSNRGEQNKQTDDTSKDNSKRNTGSTRGK
jgi:hypothetical protein